MKKVLLFLSFLVPMIVSAQVNSLSTSGMTVNPGDQVSLPVLMNNEGNVVGVSFTLTLPEGITVAVDEDNEAVYALNSTRINSNKFSVTSANVNGSWGFRLYTTSGTGVITGTEGEIMTITLNVADNIASGDYTISLTENKLSVRGDDNSVSSVPVEDAQATFTVAGSTDSNILSFADAEVKAICVANWDTDGDGELSYAEAAAVTDLGQVFQANTNITSFDELQYFTGLTEIGWEAFYHCINLTSVTLPDGITSIQQSFYDCPSLNSINIPQSVTHIIARAFEGCSSLTSISIPENIIEIGHDTFGGTGLTSVTLPSSLTKISTNVFHDTPLQTAYVNCVLSRNPSDIFPETTQVIYGEGAGYAYSYIGSDVTDYLNTDESLIDNAYLASGDRQVRIPVCINKRSNVDISQIQFDFWVRDGFSLAKNSNGNYMVEMDKTCFDYDVDFLYSHQMTLTDNIDGDPTHYRVLLTSSENATIMIDEGAMVYITVNIDDDVPEGDREMIRVDGIEFSTPSARKINPEGFSKNVKVYLRDSGDFNGDKSVSVTDYAGVVRWIAGNGYDDQGVPDWVIRKASDVNNDGSISVTDVSGIVNIILYGNYQGTTSSAKSRKPVQTAEAVLSIEPFSISAGETKEIAVELSSDDADLGQCQFDLLLPEGLSVAQQSGRNAIFAGNITKDSHQVASAQREDGTVRVLCLSGSNEAFGNNRGCIARIRVTADRDIAAGEQTIGLENVEFAKTDASKVYGAGVSATVTVSDEATGINAVSTSADINAIYGTDGSSRSALQKGMNIIRHADGSYRKVLVK